MFGRPARSGCRAWSGWAGPGALVVGVAAVAALGLAPSAHAQTAPTAPPAAAGPPATGPSATGPSAAGPSAAQPDPALLERGRTRYVEACQSCHQADGSGQPQSGIPSLHADGAAAVDWWISTGRMPEATLMAQAPRKPVSISDADRAALVAYITSQWPGGPDIPTFDLSNGDLTDGGNLYRTNCAACHGAVGAGAALAYGAYAPSLHKATALQVGEAVRIGPGNMPVFGLDNLSDEQVADVATYVAYLHHPQDRGGAGLGHTGPIAEGFVGLLFGLVGMVGVASWVGHRSDDEPQERPDA